MDIAQSIEPRSDQVNADDLVTGPQTFTIREVRKGAAESPFDFMLVETERAYRPSKTMRRMIVAAWGSEAANYVGRRLTLYREPSIRFGPDVVGGIRISAMSHIDKRVEGKFQVSRGKRETFHVDPLPDTTSTRDWQAVLDTAAGLTDVDALTELWKREGVSGAPQHVQDAISARAAEVKAGGVVTAEDAFEDGASE